MSASRGRYTLYYSLPSPFSSDETGHEEQFADIVDALSKGLLVLQNGGNPTHLTYDDVVLFSSNDLKEASKYISASGGSRTQP